MSCYPNYALGQTHDWMNEIYPLWVAAHGILLVTPVNWYQVPGPLKAMIDRLGFSHVSARPKAYKQDADAMAAFKKTLPYAWRKSA